MYETVLPNDECMISPVFPSPLYTNTIGLGLPITVFYLAAAGPITRKSLIF